MNSSPVNLPFTLTFTFIPDDHIAVARLRLRPKKWTFVLILLFASILIPGIAMMVPQWIEQRTFPTGLLWFPAIIVFGVLFNFVFLPWQVRKIFREQKSLSNELRFAFDEAGVAVETARGNGRHPWSDFHKWTADRKFVLLYQSSVVFFLLPRRAFANDADWQGFQALVRAKLGAPKY